MIKKYSISILFFLIFSSLSEAIVWESSYEKGMQQAAQTGKPVFIDFYTDWCGWCKKLDSQVYTDGDVQNLAQQMICIKVDCDRDKATAQHYQVDGYPTLIFLSSSGTVIRKQVGFADKPRVIEFLKEAITKGKGQPKVNHVTASTSAEPTHVQDQVGKAEQFYKLGVKMEQLGRKPQAINFYSKAAELAPNSLVGRKARARIQVLK